MLLDSFLAVEELRKDSPEDFDTLVRIPATFQKMHFERYTVQYLFIAPLAGITFIYSLNVTKVLFVVQRLSSSNEVSEAAYCLKS